MKTKIVSLLLCVGLLFACNNTQKGAGIGAGGGAVLGGIIGAIAGNTAVGILLHIGFDLTEDVAILCALSRVGEGKR